MREAIPTVPRLDQVATGVLILLLVASPIAFGAVHPLSYRPMEAALFGLAIVWMARVAQVARSANQSDAACRVFAAGKLALPIVAFTAFALLQLVPLPPAVIRALSPQTYELYAKSLEDWPYAAPYQHIGPLASESRAQGADQATCNPADPRKKSTVARRFHLSRRPQCVAPNQKILPTVPVHRYRKLSPRFTEHAGARSRSHRCLRGRVCFLCSPAHAHSW